MMFHTTTTMLPSHSDSRIESFLQGGDNTTGAGELREISRKYGEEARGGSIKFNRKPPKRLSRASWISRSMADKALQRMNGDITTGTLVLSIPSPASNTAQSSSSSLCSCNCNSGDTTILHPLSQCRNTSDPAILYLDHEDLPPSSGDAQRWQKIFEPPRMLRNTHPPDTCHEPIGLDSTFDLFEALALNPVEQIDGDKTPTQDDLQNWHGEMEARWSGIVEQLIKDTDDANATAPKESTNNGTTAIHTPPSHTLLRKQHTAPIARADSVSKPKRKKSQKQKNRTIKDSKSPRPAANPGLRWTLTDGMADFFNGIKFSRVTADEMLSPGRLRQLRSDGKPELEVKYSLAATRTISRDESVTLSEPFEDLPSRIHAADLKRSKTMSNEPLSRTPPIPERGSERDAVDISTAESDNKYTVNLQFRDLTFPSPPRTPLPHRDNSGISTPNLPTIPEVLPLSPIRLGHDIFSSPTCLLASEQPHHKSGSHERLLRSAIPTSQSRRESMILESTPYSLTSIGFRHGKIRLNRCSSITSTRQGSSKNYNPASKRDTNRRREDNPETDKFGVITNQKSQGNDSGNRLDLGFFQTAISEGTGDYLIGVSDDLDVNMHGYKAGLEKEIEEIADWWSGLGISLGGLQTEDPRVKSKRRLKPKLQAEGVAKRLQSVPNLEVISPRSVDSRELTGFLTKTDPNRSTWEIQFSKKTLSTRDVDGNTEQDILSLPPSPMEQLCPREFSQNSPVVPMGFNLGHDLGDFLKWENDCVAEYFSKADKLYR